MIRIMSVVSILCGVLIVAVQQVTHSAIRANQEAILRETVAQLLPGSVTQIIYAMDPSGELAIVKDVEGAGVRLYAGYDASKVLTGVVIEAAGQGYADTIRAMYAYSPQQNAITGFRVVEMRETPGLGDKIGTDKSFLDNFRALPIVSGHPIQAVKHGAKKNAWEIDAVSGATISSRAVARMLEKSTQAVVPVIQKNLARIGKGE